MRPLFVIGIALCAAASTAMVAGACNAGGGTSPQDRPDTGVAAGDTGTGQDDASAADGTTPVDGTTLADGACGTAPWVNVELNVLGITLGDAQPLTGVELTSPLCPGVVHYSDNAGRLVGQVSQNTPFYASLALKAYMPELTPEEVFDAGASVTFDMLPQLFNAILHPPLTPTSSAILVLAIATEDDAGPCSQLDGVAFAVEGHPEAQVTYYSPDSFPSAIDGGAATSSRGLATISGVAPAQFVTVTGTKTGCRVALDRGSLTGRARVEAGFLSLMPAYVSP
jgi:hypothetical protein